MAVATNWFDSHSFFVGVFIFKSTALKLYKFKFIQLRYPPLLPSYSD